ncbi:MAG: hypothetical protein M1837_005714 [Sclerophora amabilis]|nr:MAG: hypothetical protein M1837_005714 [Sclerophora amabilis]
MYTFHESRPVIDRLRRNFGLTAVPLSAQPVEFIDAALSVLGDSKFTRTDLVESQELQDNGIRKEFIAQRSYVDQRLKGADDRMEKILRIVEEQFEAMIGTSSGPDEWSRGADPRFEDQLQETQHRFETILALIRNEMAFNPWDEIQPIRSINSTAPRRERYCIPGNFPNSVENFWLLKSPKNLPKLAELLRLYKIENWKYWGAIPVESDRSADDGPLEKYSNLENAVKDNPEMALRQLAKYLGLKYDEIRQTMQKKASSKHEDIEKSLAEEGRRPPKMARPTSRYSSPRVPPELLLGRGDKIERDSWSEQSDKVMWGEPGKRISLVGDVIPSRVITEDD